MAGPGRPPGLPKTGGRKRGSLDKSQRLLLTDRMAADILKVYKRLGPDWLFTVAKERPDLFINQCLSRLLPPAIKSDEPDVLIQQQFNLDTMSDLEAARRIAFALALGAHSDNTSAPIELVQDETVEPVIPRRPDAPPEAYPNPWRPPTDAPPLFQPEPEPVDDPERTKWAENLSLTPDQRLVQNTKTESLSSYPGSSLEQGGSGPVQRQSFERDPRAAQRDRLLARRRKDLL